MEIHLNNYHVLLNIYRFLRESWDSKRFYWNFPYSIYGVFFFIKGKESNIKEGELHKCRQLHQLNVHSPYLTVQIKFEHLIVFWAKLYVNRYSFSSGMKADVDHNTILMYKKIHLSAVEHVFISSILTIIVNTLLCDICKGKKLKKVNKTQKVLTRAYF